MFVLASLHALIFRAPVLAHRLGVALAPVGRVAPARMIITSNSNGNSIVIIIVVAIIIVLVVIVIVLY